MEIGRSVRAGSRDLGACFPSTASPHYLGSRIAIRSELLQPFVSFLTEKATLAIANRWRRERGEPELNEADYIKEPPSTPAGA